MDKKQFSKLVTNAAELQDDTLNSFVLQAIKASAGKKLDTLGVVMAYLDGALIVSAAMLKSFAHDGIGYPEILQQMREGVNCLFNDHLSAYDNKEE